MFKNLFSASKICCLKYLIPVVLILSFSIITPVLAASQAHVKGEFGPLFDWPIIPIAMMLMPDGRIFAYGTTPAGVQNAKLHYAIWDPLIGTDSSAFQTLPNTTDTDIFCAGQALITATGYARGFKHYRKHDVTSRGRVGVRFW